MSSCAAIERSLPSSPSDLSMLRDRAAPTKWPLDAHLCIHDTGSDDVLQANGVAY